MVFSRPYLKCGLPLASIAFAVGLALQARGAEPQTGQAILFSSPDGDNVVSNLPSLSPRPAESLDFGSTVEAPPTFSFNRLPVGAPFPSMGPSISSGDAARVQDLLDRRNNWALLTPAEILGAATPEKIFGIPEHDAFGQRKYSTALERYNERQNQMLSARTNGLAMGNSPSVWNPFGDRDSRSNSLYGGALYPGNLGNPLFNPAADKQILGRQLDNSGWSKLFDQPAPVATPTPSPEQLADMDRFRQLLNPGSSPVVAGATPASGGIKTSLPQTLLSSGLTPPNRMGASFTPLDSRIGRAPELPKLPNAWGTSYTSPPPAEAWAPQTAPWLSPTPQPLAAPQRKF